MTDVRTSNFAESEERECLDAFDTAVPLSLVLNAFGHLKQSRYGLESIFYHEAVT